MWNIQNGVWKMEGTMSQSKYDDAADLHINAAHAHTAAAAAHHRGDHEAGAILAREAVREHWAPFAQQRDDAM